MGIVRPGFLKRKGMINFLAVRGAKKEKANYHLLQGTIPNLKKEGPGRNSYEVGGGGGGGKDGK